MEQIVDLDVQALAEWILARRRQRTRESNGPVEIARLAGELADSSARRVGMEASDGHGSR